VPVTARSTLSRREAIARARRSRKFRNWRGIPIVFRFDRAPDKPTSASSEYVGSKGVTAEKHFSPKGIAFMWGLSIATIRRLFEKEPQVLKATSRTGKRSYKTLRIPASVVAGVHRRISA
jgi:hypothetical protein